MHIDPRLLLHVTRTASSLRYKTDRHATFPIIKKLQALTSSAQTGNPHPLLPRKALLASPRPIGSAHRAQ